MLGGKMQVIKRSQQRAFKVLPKRLKHSAHDRTSGITLRAGSEEPPGPGRLRPAREQVPAPLARMLQKKEQIQEAENAASRSFH
jgi:hypothetical protein